MVNQVFQRSLHRKINLNLFQVFIFSMANTQKALLVANFGSRIAEDDTQLNTYFVETEQWRKILNGDIDIVFGAKGAGKSALYSLLVAQKEVLRLGRRTMFLAAENPRGAPAFRDLTTAPPISEDAFRSLWKLYFITIASNYLRFCITANKINNQTASEVFKILEDNNLLPPNVNLKTRLKSAVEYIRKHLPSLEGGITDPSTGIRVDGKITFSEPTAEERGLGFKSLDDLLEMLNSAYEELDITTWLVLDRLDVAFSESGDLEGNALRSLFRTYLDMRGLSNIKVKIFLRDDIWKKIVKDGFREASHVIRTMTITWDAQSLQNLIIKRLSSNSLICDLYSTTGENLQASVELQNRFFNSVFPEQIDVGQKQPKTLDWLLSRTADGTGRTAPRELIHLLIEARDEQLKLYQLGHAAPAGDRIFDKIAIKAALPAVSKARYEQTLCAENPALRQYLDVLDGEKTEQSQQTLAKLWGVTPEKALAVADQLVEAGFFERKKLKERTSFRVPFLYRDALNMVQGAAVRKRTSFS